MKGRIMACLVALSLVSALVIGSRATAEETKAPVAPPLSVEKYFLHSQSHAITGTFRLKNLSAGNLEDVRVTVRIVDGKGQQLPIAPVDARAMVDTQQGNTPATVIPPRTWRTYQWYWNSHNRGYYEAPHIVVQGNLVGADGSKTPFKTEITPRHHGISID